MKEWERNSRKLTLEQCPSEFRQKIQEHIDFFNLKNVLDNYLFCIETTSVKIKKKLFVGGIPDQTIQIAILTPEWVMTAQKGDKPDSIGVLSIQTKAANLEDYKDSMGYTLIQDNGVNITGPFSGVFTEFSAINTYFLGLGPEPAALEFKQVLFEVVEKARN